MFRLTCSFAIGIGLALAAGAPPVHGARNIEPICVDAVATGYGTFQSHNQKVVADRRGILMTRIRTRNEAYTAQQWRLSWSRDGGRSFAMLFESTDATNPPELETDDQDNLDLVRPDFVDGHAYLMRFFATNDYCSPRVTHITNGVAGKFAMVLDPARRQLESKPSGGSPPIAPR